MSTELAVAEPRTLYSVTDDLQAYIETLEMVEAQLAHPGPDDDVVALHEQKAELQTAIAAIGSELVAKTDAVAGVLRRLEAERELIKAERERLAKRAKSYDKADEWLRRYVLSVMDQRGIKQLKTATNTLFPRGSDAVVFTDAAAVPPEFLKATVTLPERLWNVARQVLTEQDMQEVRHVTEPQKAEIKKAIKGGAEVPGCDLEFRTSLCLR